MGAIGAKPLSKHKNRIRSLQVNYLIIQIHKFLPSRETPIFQAHQVAPLSAKFQQANRTTIERVANAHLWSSRENWQV